MAVNLNSSIPANQTVAGIFNPQPGVNDVARQQRPVEKTDRQIPELPRPQKVKTDATAIETLDAERARQQERNRTTPDAPDRATAKALNTYRDVANAERREEIHSLLGVDLFV